MTPDEKAIVEKAKSILERELQTTAVNSEQTVQDLLLLSIGASTTEQFGVILFDHNNRVIDVATLFYGGVRDVCVDLRKLVGFVLNSRSSRVALYHNHPSMSKAFSNEDLELTWAIRDRLSQFDVELVDHYLVTSTITSLRDCVTWPGAVQTSRIPVLGMN